MKHNTQNRRSRGRGNGARKGNKTQVFDSNGPDVRIRGTAHQVCEKYLALAKDAAAIGDKIMAENYLQHAEHYQRLINEMSKDGDRPQQKKETYSEPKSKEDDLSLPTSILGEKVEVEDTKKQLEDA